MLPRLRHKHLHRLVYRGTERQQQTQQQRIYTVYIIEVDHLQLLPPERAKQPCRHKQRKNNDEIGSMRIAEQVNGLRDTVRRYKRPDHVLFPKPALHFLRMGELDPYAVHTVRRVDGKLRHHHPVSLVQCIIAVLYRQAGYRHRIFLHFQIRVPRIVTLVQISQRIAGLCPQFPVFQVRTGIMARRTENKV